MIFRDRAMNVRTTGALAAVLALGFAAVAEAQDVIRLRSGTEIKAKITNLTSQAVTYSEGAGKVTTCSSVKGPPGAWSVILSLSSSMLSGQPSSSW